MDPDTFTRTVELLGSVIGFNVSQLTVLKEKAKQVAVERIIKWGIQRASVGSWEAAESGVPRAQDDWQQDSREGTFFPALPRDEWV